MAYKSTKYIFLLYKYFQTGLVIYMSIVNPFQILAKKHYYVHSQVREILNIENDVYVTLYPTLYLYYWLKSTVARSHGSLLFLESGSGFVLE